MNVEELLAHFTRVFTKKKGEAPTMMDVASAKRLLESRGGELEKAKSCVTVAFENAWVCANKPTLRYIAEHVDEFVGEVTRTKQGVTGRESFLTAGGSR